MFSRLLSFESLCVFFENFLDLGSFLLRVGWILFFLLGFRVWRLGF